MTSPLMVQARIVNELRDRLKAEHSLNDGDEALEDTLQGASDLPEMLADLLRKRERLIGYAKACRDIAAGNIDRASMYDRQEEAIRSLVAWALVESGLKKLPRDAAPDLVVYTTIGPAPLSIPDENAVPSEFCRYKEVYSPDRALIRSALERGERFNWATLCIPKPILVVRTR